MFCSVTGLSQCLFYGRTVRLTYNEGQHKGDSIIDGNSVDEPDYVHDEPMSDHDNASH